MDFEIMKGVLKKYMAAPGITEVTIPDGVTAIGGYAFEGCTGLTAVAIPDTVMEIQTGAFYGCTGLRSVVIPEGVTGIPDRAFSLCSKLRSVTIPDSVTEIGDYAFLHCSGLEQIILPAHLTKIGDRAFMGTGQAFLSLPDSVAEVGEEAFESCHAVLCRGVTITEMWGVKTADVARFVVRRDLSAEIRRDHFVYPGMSPMKCDTLWKMHAAHPEDTEVTAYIQQNLYGMVTFLIDQKDAARLEKVLASRVFRLDGCIDELLEYANLSEEYELWLLLLKEKDAHIGFRMAFDL